MTSSIDTRLARLSSPALSLFRIVFGLLFAIHGAQKLFDWPVAAPMPIEVGSWPAWWAGLIELVAGLLIAVGLFTRIAAFIASGSMAVAYFWRHWPPLEGEPASFWPLVNGGETAVMYCFAFLAIAGVGAGTWSVDARRRPTGGVAAGRTAAPVRGGGLMGRFRRR